MNVISQYKVIGDRIIHNIQKILLRDKIYRSEKWKDAFDFEDKNLCNSLK